MTPETRVKRQICGYLALKHRDVFFWTNDSVGIFDPVKKVYRRNQDPFRIKGTSDILGILPGGRLLAIEVKTDTGRVSPEQKAFLDKINQLGGLAFVARSVEDVIQKLSVGVLKDGMPQV